MTTPNDVMARRTARTQTSSQFRRVVDLAGLNKYLSAAT
jgi:hypothetical protein